MSTRRETLLASVGAGLSFLSSEIDLKEARLDGWPDALRVVSLEDLRALACNAGSCVYLNENGRNGLFVFDHSNLSAEVAADSSYGIYIAPASDLSGSNGAWFRLYVHNIHAKWFGVKADGLTDDTIALKAAAKMSRIQKQVLVLPSGVLRISDTIVLATSTFGYGEDSTCLEMIAKDSDAVVVQDSADFLELRGFSVRNRDGSSNGRGFVLERNNNNIIVERLLASRFAVGFDLGALNFVQAYRMLRADECEFGFRCDGRDNDRSANGTSLTFQQCYANDCGTAFDIQFVSSISLIQAIVDVKTSTSTCIKTLGVGAVNVYDFHFEGTPGVDGAYFDFTTNGNLGSALNIFGGYIDGADLTGRDFNLVRVSGNDDAVDVNIHGLGSRNIIVDGNDAFALQNITGSITLNIHGSFYPTWNADSSHVSGSFILKDYTGESIVPIASGVAYIQSGEVLVTGLNKRPAGLVQIYDDADALISAKPIITERLDNGSLRIRFADTSGSEIKSAHFSVAWVAW